MSFRSLSGRVGVSLLVPGLVLLLNACGGSARQTPLAIHQNPQSLSVMAGQPATFQVEAGGVAPLQYQWFKDGSPVAGAGSNSYNITQTTASHRGSYTAVVSNSQGSVTSLAAILTVNLPPAITAEPQPLARFTGQSATFSVTATGTGPLSYAWRKDGSILSSATTASLTLSPLTLADNGTYSVLVSSPYGTVTSADALLVVSIPFSITTQPLSTTVTAPDGATFTVAAIGPSLTYQWRKNGLDIPGATTLGYTVTATDLHEINAKYSVQLQSGVNSLVSENATLTVMAPNPTYAGDPVPVPARPLTVLPSYNVEPAFPNGAFRVGYDESLKDPVWTASGNFKFITPFPSGNRTFLADDRLAAPQVADSDYTGSGWTRGHQAMLSDVAYRYGVQAGTDTCRLTNVAPQIADHNNVIWNSLEQLVGGSNPTAWVPGLADKFNRIWIYTGPVFEDTHGWIQKSPTAPRIALPTAFYKIVVTEKTPGDPSALAILIPHLPVPPVADIWKYVTSVARVEQLAKLDLFPSLPATVTNIPAWKATVDVRGWGAPFEQTTKPNVHMVDPSWDLTVNAGDVLNFIGEATSSASTVASTQWTFGDGASATGSTASHTFLAGGPYTVTFTAMDGLGVSNSITRVVSISGGNVAPTISAIADFTIPKNLAYPLAFTVSDDHTAAGSLVLLAKSSDTALFPDDNLVLANTNGACTLTLTPAADLGGSAVITLTATDANAATSTRTFTVFVGNAPPVISTIAAQSTAKNTPKTVNFTVTDDTTAVGSILVSATSANQVLLPNANIAVVNTAGACALTLTPVTNELGSASVTVTATDGEGISSTRTFTLVVTDPAAVPTVIISQYYEGNPSASRFLEISNVGSSPVNLAAPQLYLVLYANPTGTTDFTTKVPTASTALTGTLTPGETKLFMQSGSTTPAYATPLATSSGACSFNGNDPLLLSTSNATGTAWAQRFDFIGLTDGTNWGLDRSYVRDPSIKTGKAVYTPSEWLLKTLAEVDAAAPGTTERLGAHVTTP